MRSVALNNIKIRKNAEDNFHMVNTESFRNQWFNLQIIQSASFSFSSTFCLSGKVDLIQNCPLTCFQCLFINEEFLRSKIITNFTINNIFMLSVDFSHTLLSSLWSQIILVYTMHSQYRKVEFQKLFENQRNWCYLVIQIC